MLLSHKRYEEIILLFCFYRGSFSGGGCGCGCGCGNDDLLPLLALAAAVLFLMMQGGGGRRKRSIEDRSISNDLSYLSKNLMIIVMRQ